MPDNCMDAIQASIPVAQTEKKNVPTWKKWYVGIVFIGMVVAFVTGMWNLAFTSMLAATLVVIPQCVTWKNALLKCDWNTVICCGICTAMPTGLEKSGGGVVIANFFVNLFGGENASKIVMLCVVIFLGVFLTNIMGNTGLVAALCPISLEIAKLVGGDPHGFGVVCTVACLLALSTPIATGCLTYTAMAGYKFKDYMKIGGPYNLLAGVLLCIIAPIVYTI